jgi:TRAP-type C4-dicarboxylate transport system permease small subunit
MDSRAEPRRTPWRRFTALYSRLLTHLLAFSVAILVVPVSLQIFSRFTALIPHYIWTEEMARFLFIWTIMIGAMIGVRESRHFEVDLLPRLGLRAEALARLSGRLGVLALALVFVWAGLAFTRFAWNRTSELAELPLWLIHVAWPVTGLTWLVFLGEQVLDDLRAIAGRAPPPAARDRGEAA